MSQDGPLGRDADAEQCSWTLRHHTGSVRCVKTEGHTNVGGRVHEGWAEDGARHIWRHDHPQNDDSTEDPSEPGAPGNDDRRHDVAGRHRYTFIAMDPHTGTRPEDTDDLDEAIAWGDGNWRAYDREGDGTFIDHTTTEWLDARDKLEARDSGPQGAVWINSEAVKANLPPGWSVDSRGHLHAPTRETCPRCEGHGEVRVSAPTSVTTCPACGGRRQVSHEKALLIRCYLEMPGWGGKGVLKGFVATKRKDLQRDMDDYFERTR